MAGKAAPMSPQTPWLSAHNELKCNGVTTISSSGDSDSDVSVFHFSLALHWVTSYGDVDLISSVCAEFC